MADVSSGSASVPAGAQVNSNSEESNSSTKEESNPPPEEEAKQASEEPNFECNICLDTAKDAVVSMCGHLFCWPCLHQWLETRPNRQICPVCKAAISREKVIPLYGRGGGKQQDPREKLPPRPQAQRTEPEPGGGFPNFGFNDGGFQMSFGIGGFPFGLFTSSFSWGDFTRTPAAHGSAHLVDEERFLSQIFLWVALLFIVWLFIA